MWTNLVQYGTSGRATILLDDVEPYQLARTLRPDGGGTLETRATCDQVEIC